MAIKMQRSSRRQRSAIRRWVAVVQRACDDAREATLHDLDDEGVHLARKALKRARAALRFLEDAGIQGARSRRHELARCARRLSDQRDSAVIARLAQKSLRNLRGRSRLLAQELATRRHRREGARWWQSWRRAINKSVHRLGVLENKPLSAEAFAHARDRSVRRLRRRACPSGQPEPDKVHEWRKAVVLLREQLPTLALPCTTHVRERLQARLKRLSQLLGHFVDGEILLRAVAAKGASGGASEEITWVVRRRQKHALRKARSCWKKMKPTLKHRIS